MDDEDDIAWIREETTEVVSNPNSAVNSSSSTSTAPTITIIPASEPSSQEKSGPSADDSTIQAQTVNSTAPTTVEPTSVVSAQETRKNEPVQEVAQQTRSESTPVAAQQEAQKLEQSPIINEPQIQKQEPVQVVPQQETQKNEPAPTEPQQEILKPEAVPVISPISVNHTPSAPAVEDNGKETSRFDINEYEKKLNATTVEALKLLEEIGSKATQLQDHNKRITDDIAKQRAEISNGGDDKLHKTIEDHVQVPTVSQLPSGGLPRNVESVVISGLEAVTGSVILPSGLILVTDAVQGIQLFDIEGNCVKKTSNPDWHNPRSPLYHKDHILLLADVKTDGEYLRHILKFTSDLQYVAKIEGPQWLIGRNVLVDRLSIAHTDYLYLSACGQISSAVYELSPIGQWTELDFRQSESYIDMVAFATVGPITQLLVVEGRKNYVLQLSVRESQIVDRRRLAICQRPGALARDDAGRLFVADRATACVHLVDTVKWVSAKNLACTESVVPYFNASWGLLAIPIKTAVRLQKYSFR